MKLFHDDIRRPPDDSWLWARTNEAAANYLTVARNLGDPCTEASLDHDLGLHNYDPDVPDADMQIGWDEENDGYELVKWMVENDLVPPIVTIHSWNPAGAWRMASYLRNAFKNKVISNEELIVVEKRFLRE